jgi:uncharacterized protein YoxC
MNSIAQLINSVAALIAALAFAWLALALTRVNHQSVDMTLWQPSVVTASFQGGPH